jgi:hypothetical protein
MALLIYTQIYLKMRFRRRINVPLLIATLGTVASVHHLSASLSQTSHDLKVAKEDAYNSIVSLLDARANAYDTNAAESRWLLDRERAGAHEKLYFEKVASIARFAPHHSFAETISRAKKPGDDGDKIELPGFSGSLAEELNNIRFEGEKQAALETLEAFADFGTIDAKIRELEKSGQHDQAIKLCLSYEPKGSKFTFTRFDDALGRTLTINQEHFDREVKNAFRDLSGLDVEANIAGLLLAVLVYLGLRPRMAEFG